MDDAAALVLCAHEFGIPVLGVCFGHQLVAHAFGARVIPNPKGFEVGTRDVYVNDCGRGDPLFQGLAAQLRVNLIHRDKVDFESLSGSAVRVLAGSELCDVQALAIGESIRTLQFHPEMSGELCRALVREVVPRDPGAMTATTQDTPDGFQVIRNFRRCFVEGGA